jgi:hypothetical protein
MNSRALTVCFGLLLTAACTASTEPERPSDESTLTAPPKPPARSGEATPGSVGVKELESCVTYTINGGYTAIHVCFYSEGGTCTTTNEYIGKKWSGWTEYDCTG